MLFKFSYFISRIFEKKNDKKKDFQDELINMAVYVLKVANAPTQYFPTANR
jgi:hypothetical protein